MASTHQSSAGPPGWRIAAALAIVALLAIGLLLVARSPDTSADEAASAPTSSVATGETSSTTKIPEPVVVSSSSLPAATASAGTQPTVGDPWIDLEAALEAWGVFAVTGDLGAINTTFDRQGPQYAQLKAEAVELSSEPLGPPPYDFVMLDPEIVAESPTSVAYRGDVTVSRPDSPTTTGTWEVEMRWAAKAKRWKLWTVASVGSNQGDVES